MKTAKNGKMQGKGGQRYSLSDFDILNQFP